jgi:hypothetical protein
MNQNASGPYQSQAIAETDRNVVRCLELRVGRERQNIFAARVPEIGEFSLSLRSQSIVININKKFGEQAADLLHLYGESPVDTLKQIWILLVLGHILWQIMASIWCLKILKWCKTAVARESSK